MVRPLLLALVASLLVAGCAAPEEEPAGASGGDGASNPDATPAGTTPTHSPTPSPAPDAAGDEEAFEPGSEEEAEQEPADESDEPPATTTPASPLAATPASTPPPAPPAVDMGAPTTVAPADDTDRDGIPDSLERALGTSCTIEGRTCASLGLSPPTVGARDLIFLQVGRSGTMQDWRYSAAIWDGVKQEMANLSIVVQVADLGVVASYDRDARWSDTSRDGRFWTHYVIYNDPATAVTDDASGSQMYDEITLAERGDPIEERATILHEAYHALLGDLDGGRSTCANEEIGGPSHSADAGSVLYTSPDCETNEGNVYRLGRAELLELREKPFSVLTEMNEAGWTEAPTE